MLANRNRLCELKAPHLMQVASAHVRIQWSRPMLETIQTNCFNYYMTMKHCVGVNWYVYPAT